MTMSSIESCSCFPFLNPGVKRRARNSLVITRNGKYVKIYYVEAGREIFRQDFIIYDTLMLQLEAHKINDTVSFIFSLHNESF